MSNLALTTSSSSGRHTQGQCLTPKAHDVAHGARGTTPLSLAFAPLRRGTPWHAKWPGATRMALGLGTALLLP